MVQEVCYEYYDKKFIVNIMIQEVYYEYHDTRSLM